MNKEKYMKRKAKITKTAEKVQKIISKQARKMQKYVKRIDGLKKKLDETLKNIKTSGKENSKMNIKKLSKILQNLKQIRFILSDTQNQINQSKDMFTNAAKGVGLNQKKEIKKETKKKNKKHPNKKKV